MDIELTNLTTEHLKPRAIIKLIKKAGRLAGLPRKALISIAFIDAEKIRVINKNYRDQDEPTDVLAFLYSPATTSHSKFIIPKFVRTAYGEIFLCPEIIKEKAKERGFGEEEYQKLLLVHAALHLKGLEHSNNEQAKKMAEKEREILEKL